MDYSGNLNYFSDASRVLQISKVNFNDNKGEIISYFNFSTITPFNTAFWASFFGRKMFVW